MEALEAIRLALQRKKEIQEQEEIELTERTNEELKKVLDAINRFVNMGKFATRLNYSDEIETFYIDPDSNDIEERKTERRKKFETLQRVVKILKTKGYVVDIEHISYTRELRNQQTGHYEKTIEWSAPTLIVSWKSEDYNGK